MSSLEEQLATATIAKIFGSELKKVDEFTTHQSSNGPATRLDPASFITAVHERKKQVQQNQVAYSNMLAEQLHPLPTPVQAIEPLPPPPAQINANNELVEAVKSIDKTLTKLLNFIESKWQSVY